MFSDGTGSTSAGLTASAVRDDFGDSGEWTIKGGTIVKAHKGLACVDELDDMDEDDRSSLHSALERQEVPVAKRWHQYDAAGTDETAGGGEPEKRPVRPVRADPEADQPQSGAGLSVRPDLYD